MIVIMNNKGEYAKVSVTSTHVGTKQSLDWVSNINFAGLFPDKFHKRDYDDKVFIELSAGIFIKAIEHRTVTLLK